LARSQDGSVIYAPLDRAIVDAARQITDLAEIRELVASAGQRGKVLIAHLARQLDAGPAAGSARLRRVLAEVADAVRSAAEADLRTLIIQSRLPTPLYNPSLYVGGGFWPGRTCGGQEQAWPRRSIPWPGTLLPADYERTLARHDRMIAQGIRVLHFAPRQLRIAKREVAQQIRSTLAQSTGPLPHIVTRPAP
jgi:hypothetical protein